LQSSLHLPNLKDAGIYWKWPQAGKLPKRGYLMEKSMLGVKCSFKIYATITKAAWSVTFLGFNDAMPKKFAAKIMSS
jgi:hypothetical protein